MKRRDFLIGTSGAALGATAAHFFKPNGEGQPFLSAFPERKNRKPLNFVVLLADDLRWDGIGVAGNRFAQTPNIDQLARNAAIYSNAFVTTSVCFTSRASIMLGQTASQHGIWDLKTPLSPEQSERTYHKILKRHGYKVGYIGKWGCAGEPAAGDFDVYDGFENLGHYAWPEKIGTQHMTNYQGRAAASFIEQQSTDRPFCLTVAFWAPHAQSDQADNEMPFATEDGHLYRLTDITVPPTFTDTFAPNLPAFLHEAWAKTHFERRLTTPEKTQNFIKGYYRLIAGMDRSIGNIVAALDKAGLREQTAILFLSDNGFMLGEHGFVGKWLIFDESIRIPLIVQLPAAMNSPGQWGGVINSFALNIDIAPTILSLAGIAPDSNMSGLNLATARPRDGFFYEYKLAPFLCLGLRNANWKYALYPGENYEQMFSLRDDPHETVNLANHPDFSAVQETMKAQVMAEYANSPLLKAKR